MCQRLLRGCVLVALSMCWFAPSRAAEQDLAKLVSQSQRILFLGDSITHAGQYIVCFDAWLESQGRHPLVINAGLPSETVSGLSEEGHAGGKFPRPDLAERLERVLKLTQPDLVFACYGINCGIYQPFDKERFARYQAGMRHLKKLVEEAGATLVIITPPSYDDQQAKSNFSYNDVLTRYSQWLLAQRDQGWLVIDLHGPMTAELARRRQSRPAFTFQPDAVHPDEAGHWFMAATLIRACGDAEAASATSAQQWLLRNKLPAELLTLVGERENLLRDAYVAGAGHKRPGVKSDVSLEEATKTAAELSARIQQLTKSVSQSPPKSSP